MSKQIAPSRQLAIKLFDACFKLLIAEGGSMVRKDLFETLKNKVQFTDWELNYDATSGSHRWEKIFSFYTIPFSKAGYLIKKKGIWTITPEGETAFKKGAPEMIEMAVDKYKEWSKDNPATETSDSTQIEEIGEKTLQQSLGDYEATANEGIRKFIKDKNPYEFQEFVATLLRAMDYYTDYIADKGKDGGIDIVAYQDPLGIKNPRIKVQVKHYPENPISVDEIRKLKGILNQGNEVGLFVTSGSFTNDSKRTARESGVHIKLIDGEELIELWLAHYHKLNDEDKSQLPLQPIYFLRSGEI